MHVLCRIYTYNTISPPRLFLCLFYSIERLDKLYAFTFSPREQPVSSGWGSSSPMVLLEQWKCSEEQYRVSEINKGFKLCPSYPEQVIVPASISDEDIVKVCMRA